MKKVTKYIAQMNNLAIKQGIGQKKNNLKVDKNNLKAMGNLIMIIIKKSKFQLQKSY